MSEEKGSKVIGEAVCTAAVAVVNKYKNSATFLSQFMDPTADGLEKMAAYRQYHPELAEREYVVGGSIVGCSFGTKLSRLDLPTDHGVYDRKGNPVMVCSDCKVGANVYSFGMCESSLRKLDLDKRCRMAITGEWKEAGDVHTHIWSESEKCYKKVLTIDGFQVCLHGYGLITIREVNGNLAVAEGLNEVTVSQEYINFVIEYEGGNTGTKWQYAQDLGDGVITVAFGVVIKDRNGNYPLKKEKYDELMALKSNQIPLTWTEALDLTMDYMESSYVTSVNQKATEKGWTLNQNRFDALVDMVWNCGSVALDYKVCEYLATGNLNDPNILSELEREIAETAHMEINGVNQWTKNLVERRADVIRIAQGGSDAYTRNEFTNQHWNQNAYTILSNMGLDAATINKYPIQ